MSRRDCDVPRALDISILCASRSSSIESGSLSSAAMAIHCFSIILNLQPVVTSFGGNLFLWQDSFIDIRLRALNPSRCGRFLQDMHPDEEINVWYQVGISI